MQKCTLSVLFWLHCLLFSLLNGCASHRPVVIDTATLTGLKALGNTQESRSRSKNTSKIREMAIKETALGLGAQAGLAYRANYIDQELIKQARQLDVIYDFNALILEHNIIPPVLLEGRNTLNLADAQTIRISDRTYKVTKQAHFITTAPNWRQYLWLDYKRPDPPHVSLLPQTKKEKKLWCTYVEQGWRKGIEQAVIILEENVARIKEDYAGMILYRKLLAMNMVSPPFVSHTELGITGDASEIHIDDRVLRITALPALNTNSKEWIAPVTPDEKTLIRLQNMANKANNTSITISSKAWQPVIAPINERTS